MKSLFQGIVINLLSSLRLKEKSKPDVFQGLFSGMPLDLTGF